MSNSAAAAAAAAAAEQHAEQLHAVRRRAAAVRRVGAGQAGDRHLPAPPGAQLPVGAGGAGPGLRLPLRRLPQGPADQGTEDRRRAQRFDGEHSNVAARAVPCLAGSTGDRTIFRCVLVVRVHVDVMVKKQIGEGYVYRQRKEEGDDDGCKMLGS